MKRRTTTGLCVRRVRGLQWRGNLVVAAAILSVGWIGVEAATGATISTITPSTALTAEDSPYCTGTTITITGTGFVGDGPSSSVKVSFNGVAATYVLIGSDQSLTTAVPTGATSGPVSVTTAAGTATSTTPVGIIPCPGRESSAGLTSHIKPAAISTISPAKGKTGTSVLVKGSGFANVTGVKFGGAPSVFKVISKTTIRATVPARAKSGKITVVTDTGTATSAQRFVKL